MQTQHGFCSWYINNLSCMQVTPRNLVTKETTISKDKPGVVTNSNGNSSNPPAVLVDVSITKQASVLTETCYLAWWLSQAQVWGVGGGASGGRPTTVVNLKFYMRHSQNCSHVNLIFCRLVAYDSSVWFRIGSLGGFIHGLVACIIYSVVDHEIP